MFDPHQLRIFLVAAETLNFSQAARQLHLSQPSITQNIQALENQIGEKLFVRSGRGLELTETGRTLLPMAHQVVAVNMRTLEMIETFRGQVTGHLVIACSTTPGKYVLPVVLADFLRIYPKVSGCCQVTSRKNALEMLAQGQVHFAFSSSTEEFDQNIEFCNFLSDPVTLIAPLGHPWAERGEIELDELRSERFILREETAGTYKVVKTELSKQGFNIHDLQVALTMGNSEAIAIAVQQGVGVGFITQMVLTHVVSAKVAPVRIRGLNFRQDIFICRHRLQQGSSAQTAFWGYIRSISPETFAHPGDYVNQVRLSG